MTTLHRAIATVVALCVMSIALALCYRKLRARKRQGLWVALGCYCLVLLGTFLFGVIADDGFGWAFLPLMIVTAPWSFFVAAPVSETLNKWGLSWIGPLLMNFLVIVVISGGLNILLLYFFIKRIAFPPARPSIT